MTAPTPPIVPPPDLFALLVDRDDDTRYMYAEYFQAHRCHVEEAIDGREALAKALAVHHHVIVTETQLPGIDGHRLCELLRRDEATRETPIIVVTATASFGDIERAYRSGADLVLAKPCLPDTLWSQVRALLDSGAGEAAAGTVVPGHRLDDRVRRPSRRPVLSRLHQRGDTTSPPKVPPPLVCPACDALLIYLRSQLGGVSERHAEQWDYYECPNGCGPFQYRHRTRKLRPSG
jgi:CheY-like chemotaxis protein